MEYSKYWTEEPEIINAMIGTFCKTYDKESDLDKCRAAAALYLFECFEYNRALMAVYLVGKKERLLRHEGKGTLLDLYHSNCELYDDFYSQTRHNNDLSGKFLFDHFGKPYFIKNLKEGWKVLNGSEYVYPEDSTGV